jgi:lipid-binding SYLF domain-containing protein
MYRFRYLVPALVLLFLSAPSFATVRDDQALIDSSARTVRALRQQYPRPVAQALVRAKAVVVFPTILQAGFVVGGAGGPGVLSVRKLDGSWSNPAFYGYVAASVGLQIGVQGRSVLIAVMTDAALNRLMEGNIKLGADVSIAAGPVGGGASIGSVSSGTDLLIYSKDAGLFAGGALDGSVLSPSLDRDQEFYGPNATPRSILTDPRKDPRSASLRAALRGTTQSNPAAAALPAH